MLVDYCPQCRDWINWLDGPWEGHQVTCRGCGTLWLDGGPVRREDMFMGEVMCCALCTAQVQSDARVASGWRSIRLDARAYYVCPRHFPPDGPQTTRQQYRDAYLEVIRSLASKT